MSIWMDESGGAEQECRGDCLTVLCNLVATIVGITERELLFSPFSIEKNRIFSDGLSGFILVRVI